MGKKPSQSNRGSRRAEKAAARKSKKSVLPVTAKRKPPGGMGKGSQGLPSLGAAASTQVLDLVNTGVSLQKAGSAEEARGVYEKALSLNPGNPDLMYLVASAELDLGNLEKAEEGARGCLAKEPNRARYHKLLGNCLREQGRHKESLLQYRMIEIEEPDSYDYHNFVAGALFNLSRFDKAIPHYQKAIELEPKKPDPYSNLSVTFRRNGMFPEALESAKKGIEVAEKNGRLLGEYGAALNGICQFKEGEKVVSEALEMCPDNFEIYNYMGESLKGQGRFVEAFNFYKKSNEMADRREALSSLALICFCLGKIDLGWRGYDLRLDQSLSSTNPWIPGIHVWDGKTDVSDKNLLVCMEQGIGDEVMLANMLPDLMKGVRHVFCIMEPRLMPIMTRSFPEVTFVERVRPPTRDYADGLGKRVDSQVAAGTLGRLFRKNVESFPRHDGYLKADPDRVRYFREKYTNLFPGKKLVGFSWFSGNAEFGQVRSLPIDQWGAILDQEKVAFINLQYGEEAKKADDLGGMATAPIHTDTEVDSLKSMEDFFSQVAALDLIISIDNSTVHVAGALGVPVWLMLPINHDWRWFGFGESSPWYPSARLYRQKEYQDWGGVLSRVAADLAAWGREKG